MKIYRHALCYYILLALSPPLWANILEISKDTTDPIYQGVPFNGILKISPFPLNANILQENFSKIQQKSSLHILQFHETKRLGNSLEIAGLFSLFSVPKVIAIDQTNYELKIPSNNFIPASSPAQAIISLDHKIKKRHWYHSPLWIILLSVLLISLLYPLRKMFLKYKLKKERNRQANNMIQTFRNANRRKDFEEIYLRKDHIYQAFALQNKSYESNQMDKKLTQLFETIGENIYIRHWGNDFLQKLCSMKNKI